MAYLQLFLGIVIEVGSTSLLKLSDGFTRLGVTAVCLVGYGLCFWLVARSVETLPLGFVYAVWSGIGTVTIAIIGALAYSEGMGPARIAGILLVVAGIVTLNLAGAS